MIQVQITEKRFGKVPVLGQIDLTVPQGETAVLLGPSGVGKSTLLRIIAGLDTDVDGPVTVRGRLGVVFQDPALLMWRSALDNITLMTGACAEQARDLLAAMGLAGKDTLFPGQMSLGQQRRLSIARALAAKPQVLLLDEPFASLDKGLAAEMAALVKRSLRAHNITCLMITHDLTEATGLADAVYRLQGTPARLYPQGPSSSHMQGQGAYDHGRIGRRSGAS